jgi:predicted ATPase
VIIVNLFGGPGAGKTTLAYYLAYRFKQAGFRAELVGEAARELIYDRNNPKEGGVAAQLIDNQFLISGLQAERFKRLERHGIEVAIADSPLKMGLLYVKEHDMRWALTAAIEAFNKDFQHQINVLVQRTRGKYDMESRAQTEDEAVELDRRIEALIGHQIGDYATVWGQEALLFDYLLPEAKRGWN